MGQMLYFTESGHLGVLSAGLCLALVFGPVSCNEHVERARREAAKKDGKIWDWRVTSGEHSGVYLCDTLVNGQLVPRDHACTLRTWSVMS